MAWLQLKLNASDQQSEQIEDALLEAGALSVSFHDRYDNPILEPAPGETPLWPDMVLTALFEESADASAIESSLFETLGDIMPSCEWEVLEDKVWEREWLQHFEPIAFGNTLWVCPSEHQVPSDGRVVMHLDPGLAFGTGTHPTTALCLAWLAENPPQGGVIDYGCGSGILSIGALLLGAEHAWAVDIDQQALSATWDNAERNGVAGDQLTIGLPESLGQLPPQPLLVANILAGPLIELAPQLAKLVRVDGQAVLSGILNEQADGVIAAWSDAFSPLEVKQQGDWCRIVLRRKPDGSGPV